jgi:hypothetical protein
MLIAAVGLQALAVAWGGGESGATLPRILDRELAAARRLGQAQGWRPELPVVLANGLYGIVFRQTGIESMAWQMARETPFSIPDTVLREFWRAHHHNLEQAMLVTQLLGVRLSCVMRMVPLAGLLCFVSLIDGLTARAIRREAGGRESAASYHRAKQTLIGFAGGGFCILMLWPWEVAWEGLLPIPGIALALLLRWQAASYKKHA